MPSSIASVSMSRSCVGVSAATISSTQSAPIARAAMIWYGSITKSLRSTGSEHAARAWRCLLYTSRCV